MRIMRGMSHDTRALNQAMDRFDRAADLWLFAYGSLIWKADFAFLERREATLPGWSRRFWQGSHDHRGTPHHPGRVVTLVTDAEAACAGVAYRITPAVFDHLDHREKNGYLRLALPIRFADGAEAEALVYVADAGNAAWLGPATTASIAADIASAHGPSGSNREYLERLAKALGELGAIDGHVEAILRALPAQDRSIS